MNLDEIAMPVLPNSTPLILNFPVSVWIFFSASDFSSRRGVGGGWGPIWRFKFYKFAILFDRCTHIGKLSFERVKWTLVFFLFFTFSPCLACFRFVWFPRSFPLFRAVSLVGLWQISLKYCWNNFGRLSLWLIEFLNSQRFRFCALCVCPKKVRWVIFFAFMFFKNGLYSFHSHSLSENYVSFNLLHWIK